MRHISSVDSTRSTTILKSSESLPKVHPRLNDLVSAPGLKLIRSRLLSLQKGGIPGRSDRRRGREGQIPAGRRKGVQEPIVGGYRHHRQSMQRLSLLEHRDRQRSSRASGAGKLGGRGLRRCGDPRADACCWVPPSAQPEGRRGGAGETLLRRLPEELHRAFGRTCGDLRRRARPGCHAAGSHSPTRWQISMRLEPCQRWNGRPSVFVLASLGFSLARPLS